MATSQVTIEIKGTFLPGEILQYVEALGDCNPQNAVAPLAENETAESMYGQPPVYPVEEDQFSITISKGAFKN